MEELGIRLGNVGTGSLLDSRGASSPLDTGVVGSPLEMGVARSGSPSGCGMDIFHPHSDVFLFTHLSMDGLKTITGEEKARRKKWIVA